MDDATLLARILNDMEIEVTQAQLAALLQHKAMVLEWNQRVNLTAILDNEEFLVKHLADSLTLLKAAAFPQGSHVVDVGSGAGFPGIPLKIMREGISLCLMDSLKKRLDFLDRVIASLELIGATTVHLRAEEAGRDKQHRQQYDMVISRAVAPLNILAEYCLPLVKTGGKFLAMKGPGITDELDLAKEALKLLGGRVGEAAPFCLPLTGEARTIVVIEKEKATPEQYPRKPGIPTKKPLNPKKK